MARKADYLLVLGLPKHTLAGEALRQLVGVTGVARTEGEPRYRVSFQRGQTNPTALFGRGIGEAVARCVPFHEGRAAPEFKAFMDLDGAGSCPPTIGS